MGRRFPQLRTIDLVLKAEHRDLYRLLSIETRNLAKSLENDLNAQSGQMEICIVIKPKFDRTWVFACNKVLTPTQSVTSTWKRVQALFNLSQLGWLTRCSSSKCISRVRLHSSLLFALWCKNFFAVRYVLFSCMQRPRERDWGSRNRWDCWA